MRHLTPLLYVDAVAKAGSIRAAADTLAITASALNRRILALEEELEVDLFERTTTGVRLNLAGEFFVQHVRAQQADLNRVKSRIADLKGMRLGRVRIAASQSVMQYFLPHQVSQYVNEFPGVNFEVTTSNRSFVEKALAEQEVDLAVVIDPLRMPEFYSLILKPQPIHCLMPNDHPLAGKTSLRLTDVLQYKLLLTPRGQGVREKLEAAAMHKGLHMEASIEANDPSFIEALIRDGSGLGFILPIAQPATERNDGLIAIPMNSDEVKPPILFVGQRKDRTLPVAAGKFVEQLRKALEV